MNDPAESSCPPLTLWLRIRVFCRLLFSVRRHDFRAARTFMGMAFPEDGAILRVFKFAGWALHQMWCCIPDAMRLTRFADEVSEVPFWLAEGNPYKEHPWVGAADSELPEEADTVVIGCGLGGCAAAYHWGRKAPDGQKLVALDMGDPASGSAGRNEGLVVMGRYFYMVVHSVLPYLEQVQPDRSPEEREILARQFAARYAEACYRNADLVEETIREEGFDCHYAREGWVQAREGDEQDSLAASVRMTVAEGLTDWTQITPDEAEKRTGMKVRHNAGYSVAAATFHPAKWCWSLLDRALASGTVELYTRTKVLDVKEEGGNYHVRTDRGTIVARNVLLCTESYTPLLMPMFHDMIRPTQTQAATGPGGPPGMKPHIGISNRWGFFGRHGDHTMVGSDATRVPDHEAGRIQPSRFLTHFLCAEMQRAFGRSRYEISNEWSGTVSYTPDEYPVVGTVDDKRLYILGGMAGSGTAVSFNGARCLVNRMLGDSTDPDDYPESYFSPKRLLDPANHRWPELEKSNGLTS